MQFVARDNLMFRNFKVVGRSQLLLATGTRTPLCIANRRQETAPTSACFKPPECLTFIIKIIHPQSCHDAAG